MLGLFLLGFVPRAARRGEHAVPLSPCIETKIALRLLPGMDKAGLLQQLALVRERAEAAHLEIVICRNLIAKLEGEDRDAAAARFQLITWKMREQKLLREMDWILDRLEEMPSR